MALQKIKSIFGDNKTYIYVNNPPHKPSVVFQEEGRDVAVKQDGDTVYWNIEGVTEELSEIDPYLKTWSEEAVLELLVAWLKTFELKNGSWYKDGLSLTNKSVVEAFKRKLNEPK